MTGLLCITALTNEHSNKGELKDQSVSVHVCVNGVAIRMCRTEHTALFKEDTYKGK